MPRARLFSKLSLGTSAVCCGGPRGCSLARYLRIHSPGTTIVALGNARIGGRPTFCLKPGSQPSARVVPLEYTHNADGICRATQAAVDDKAALRSTRWSVLSKQARCAQHNHLDLRLMLLPTITQRKGCAVGRGDGVRARVSHRTSRSNCGIAAMSEKRPGLIGAAEVEAHREVFLESLPDYLL
ncbi:hypothetical protein GGR52DRAFT_412361 [Hypoxylon sp. FL1284]|nr:hypothetical protein GGR52DRAFT_412361 [Hypoxylon sp. FL1284]